MDKLNSTLRIVFTGPESSGKTTLSTTLAQGLHMPLVPEFARPYLQHLGRKYVYNDLKLIYSGQKSWENWYAQKRLPIVCDTDWTVIRIWESFGYQRNTITQHETPSPDTYYFLCSPDIPWQPDPLREHPFERRLLFEQYLQLLTDSKARFSILEGDINQRLKMIRAVVRKFY